jgi:hypothetical protein
VSVQTCLRICASAHRAYKSPARNAIVLPYIATSESGEQIIAEEADQEDTYLCPECDEVLKIRSSHYRDGSFVSRHFWHPRSAGGDECASVGGESAEHKRMKSIAMSKAKEHWPDATVKLEACVGQRRADVLVTFPEPKYQYGRGVAIECQHKNEQKNTDAVTADFHDEQHSVLWLYEEQYNEGDVNLEAGTWCRWMWARDVPARQSWSGYHGVVHWLRQDKPTEVTFNVPLPGDIHDIYQTRLRMAWRRGQLLHNRLSTDKRDKTSHRETATAISDGGTGTEVALMRDRLTATRVREELKAQTTDSELTFVSSEELAEVLPGSNHAGVLYLWLQELRFTDDAEARVAKGPGDSWRAA